jgi:3-hydroxybutyryl-CoA dehydratase
MDAPKTAEQLTVGEKSSIAHVVTEADLAMFGGATGDVNPIHFDSTYAEKTFFKGRIAHGMLSAGFISAVIANRLPGISSIYVSQNLRFLGPVRIGDTVTAEVEVLEIDAAKNRVKLRTTCTNQAGAVVLDGEAVVMPPKRTADITEDADLPNRIAEAENRIGAATKAFWAAFRGEEPKGAAESETLADRTASLWAGQVDRWLGSFSAYQDQMERLFGMWMDQTVAAQRESQRLVQDWVLSMSRGSADICTVWERNVMQAGRMLGLDILEKTLPS